MSQERPIDLTILPTQQNSWVGVMVHSQARLVFPSLREPNPLDFLLDRGVGLVRHVDEECDEMPICAYLDSFTGRLPS